MTYIFKYTKKRIDFIIVIEPDYENIKEFFQRYNIIEPVKKEIYDKIIKTYENFVNFSYF